jgi:uncharacterized protein YceH (UPF0502 family)
MSLCAYNHDEVVYTTHYCPVCAERDNTAQSDKELSAALAKVEALEEELSTLKERLDTVNQFESHAQ